MSTFSVLLPKTSFVMKGKLPDKEPDLLRWWQDIDLYQKIRDARKQRPMRSLLDGPPYANGPIHMGHALNKVLKDFVNRFNSLCGYDIHFAPGWDCHGLPIEAKIEEQFLKKGLSKNDVPVTDLRQACHQFAEEWIQVQKEQFKRLGVLADWQHIYRTMDPSFEAEIVRDVFELLKKGLIYRGMRPVLWSCAEETALAEAEVEYKDIVSASLYVKFPLEKTFLDKPASVVIWTTTPWSLPGNRAICYLPDAVYVLIEITKIKEGSLWREKEHLLCASDCLQNLTQETGIEECQVLQSLKGKELAGWICNHPLKEDGYTFEVPLLPGDHVTTDSGTGFVHTAPGHGLEDFAIGKQYDLELPETILDDGSFCPHIPLFAGLNIWKAAPAMQEALRKRHMLGAHIPYSHSYPHSWRSKKPLCYRATPQWFISLDGPALSANGQAASLRQSALRSIEQETVQWRPRGSENRIGSMIAGRPDWCISRKRAWGVPLTFFLHKETGQCLMDEAIFQAICDRVRQEGVGFWLTDEAWSFLPATEKKEDWIKIEDIIDVWLESGLVHRAFLKQIDSEKALWPSWAVLEGSDQHRGWFQSSFLTSMALEGKTPFHFVFTHGFLLDDKGRKQSKSLGNVTDPHKVIAQDGADILRLWVAHEDYEKDLRASDQILQRVKDLYRRFRNILRYTLGGLHDFSPGEWIDPSLLPTLEKWVMHKLHLAHQKLHASLGIVQKDQASASSMLDFQSIVRILHQLCCDLSSFYLDVRKDILYCSAPDSFDRQAVRTTLMHIFLFIARWLSPILCFTTEEAFQCFCKDILKVDVSQGTFEQGHPLLEILIQNNLLERSEFLSIHLQNLILDLPAFPEAHTQVQALLDLRHAITQALEQARNDKKIASSLEAHPYVFLPEHLYSSSVLNNGGPLLADLCITSNLTIQTADPLQDYPFFGDVGVLVRQAVGKKCQRCWKILPEVNTLCDRCQSVTQNSS